MTGTNLLKRKLHHGRPKISVIIPVHNAEAYLPDCLESIWKQTYQGGIEVSIFVDGCTDNSEDVCREWQSKFLSDNRFTFVMSKGHHAKGAGFARNRAVEQSSGTFLCIHDADDISVEQRIEYQLEKCLEYPDAIVGSRFTRIPEDATARYSKWCNNLSHEELLLHRFREVTVIQPTWFFHRKVWERVGGYVEFEEDGSRALAEDLRFFYKHLECWESGELENKLAMVDHPLIAYRHVATSLSSLTPRRLLTELRIKALQKSVLLNWDSFGIWGAGKDGKDFLKKLAPEFQDRVSIMFDIDPKKIKNGYNNPNLKRVIDVVHFTEAKPPFITCVALDRTGGAFEQNLASLNLKEGKDYFHFC